MQPKDNVNGNTLASVCIDTTGSNPREHDLIRIAIVPLYHNTFERHRDFRPYVTELRPIHDYPLLANREYRRDGSDTMTHRYRTNTRNLYDAAEVRGVDRYDAAALLDNWFLQHKCFIGKRLIPIGYDWPFISSFMIHWLGYDEYTTIFDYRYRDLLPLYTMENDHSVHTFSDTKFKKVDFSYVATQMGFPPSTLQLDVGERALVQAAIYKEYLTRCKTLR
jgi:hypothetical protein